MSTPVIMPQMGESIAEGTITKWLKKVGDTVKRDEPIFEISTDKVDAEIPSPVAGTLTRDQGRRRPDRRHQHGRRASSARRARRPPLRAAAPAPRPRPLRPRPAAAAPPRRTGPANRRRPRRPRRSRLPPRRAAPPRRRSRAAGRPSRPSREASGGQVESIEERIRQRSSPLVRKIAQENGLDIRRDRGHRHPQPGHQERRPLVPREPQGRARRRRGLRRGRPRPSAPSVGRAEPAEAAPAPRPADPRHRPRRGRRDDEDPQDHGREHDPLQEDLGPRDDRLPGRLHEHRAAPGASTRTTSSRRTA